MDTARLVPTLRDAVLRAAPQGEVKYGRQPLSLRIVSSPRAPFAVAYLRRISASERAWYFCGSCDHDAPPRVISKLLSPRSMAAALATVHGRNSAATSSFRSDIRVGASADHVSNGPSDLGETMRCTHSITLGDDARMIAPGVGSVAAS